MSDFKPGDNVELVEEVTDSSWGQTKIPAGTTGKLGRLYREQDGLEMWAMWLDKALRYKSLLGVNHRQIRKVPP